jgi:hypothetical protein
MANMNRSISEQTALETVQKQFEAWRSGRANKREPIPRHLWQAAAGLCREYSIARVSRELRLSYTDLKKKIRNDNSTSARFVEIDTTFLGGQWQIECSRVDGSCLRMTGYGFAPEIDGLLRSFLP